MTHSPLSHERTFAIAWGDMDAIGHVNNSRYFDYFQEARIEWLASIKFAWTRDEGPVVVHTSCDYIKPIVYPATITLKSKLQSIGNTSVTIDHDLYQNDTLMAQGLSKIVWVNYKASKAIPLPKPIREFFQS